VTRFGAKFCWLCGAVVQTSWEKAGPHLSAGAVAPPITRPLSTRDGLQSLRPADSPAHFQFGLSTLLLIVTLVSIICSISVMAPGLGVVVAIISLFGILGAVKRSAAAEAKGVPLSQTEKVGAFFRSAGITFMVLVIIGLVIAVVIVVGLYIFCSVSRM
jgi:hypothetical protein